VEASLHNVYLYLYSLGRLLVSLLLLSLLVFYRKSRNCPTCWKGTFHNCLCYTSIGFYRPTFYSHDMSSHRNGRGIRMPCMDLDQIQFCILKFSLKLSLCIFCTIYDSLFLCKNSNGSIQLWPSSYNFGDCLHMRIPKPQ